MPFLLWTVRGADWQITDCSDELLRACTYKETSPVGSPLSQLIGAQGEAEVKNWSGLVGGAVEPLQFHTVIRRHDRTTFGAEVNVARIQNTTPPDFAFLAIAEPVRAPAEPRTTTVAADQAKFDALAIVAQGMGHEINNPLQIILGNAEHMLEQAQDTAFASGLKDILAAGERIKATVANLKDFVNTQEK